MSFGEAAKLRPSPNGLGFCTGSLGNVDDTHVLSTIISLSSQHWGPAPTCLNSLIRRTGMETMPVVATLYKSWGVCAIGFLMQIAHTLPDAKVVFHAIPDKHFEGKVSSLYPPAYLAVHVIAHADDEYISKAIYSVCDQNNSNFQADLNGLSERPKKFFKSSSDPRRAVASNLLSQLDGSVITNPYILSCAIAANENDPRIGDRYTPEEMRQKDAAKMDMLRIFNDEDPVHHCNLFDFNDKIEALTAENIAIDQGVPGTYLQNGHRVVCLPEYTEEDNINFTGVYAEHDTVVWVNTRVREEHVSGILSESFPWVHKKEPRRSIIRTSFNDNHIPEELQGSYNPYHTLQSKWQETGVHDKLQDYAPAIVKRLKMYNTIDNRKNKLERVCYEADKIIAITLGSFSSRQTGIPCTMSSTIQKLFSAIDYHKNEQSKMRKKHGALWIHNDEIRKQYPKPWIMFRERCKYNADPLSSALMELGDILCGHGYESHVGVLLTLYSLAAMSGSTRLMDRIAVALDGPPGTGKTRLLIKLRRMLMEYKLMSAETEKSLTCVNTDNERSDCIACFSDEGFESMRNPDPSKPSKVTAASRLWQQVLSDARIVYELIGRSERDPSTNTYRREKETISEVLRWWIIIAVNDFDKSASPALVDRFLVVKMAKDDRLAADVLQGRALLEPHFQESNDPIITQQEDMFRVIHAATYLINLLSATGFIPLTPDVSNLYLIIELMRDLPAVKFLGFDSKLPIRVIVKMRNRLHAEVILRICMLVYYYGVLGADFTMGELIEFVYSQFFVTTEMAVTNYVMGIFTINYDKDNTRVHADIKDNELEIDIIGKSEEIALDTGRIHTESIKHTRNYPLTDDRGFYSIRHPEVAHAGSKGQRFPILYNEISARLDFGKIDPVNKINTALDQLKNRQTSDGRSVAIPTTRGRHSELLVHPDGLKDVVGPSEKLMLRILGEVCKKNVLLAKANNHQEGIFEDINNVRYVQIPFEDMEYFIIPGSNIAPKQEDNKTWRFDSRPVDAQDDIIFHGTDSWFSEKLAALRGPAVDTRILRYAHDRNKAIWHLLRNTVLMTGVPQAQEDAQTILRYEYDEDEYNPDPPVFKVMVQMRALEIPFEDYINTVTHSILEEMSYAIHDTVIAHSPCGPARVIHPHRDNKTLTIKNPLHNPKLQFKDTSASLFPMDKKEYVWESRQSTNNEISKNLYSEYCGGKWKQPPEYVPGNISRRIREQGLNVQLGQRM